MKHRFKKGLLFFALIILLFGNLKGYAQNTGVLPATPNSSSLGKYIDNPVSFYTGKPEINVPLYNISLRNGFSLPIALNYNAGGIKVEEVASSVGLGWSLIAGGMITRIISGLPDDYDCNKFVIIGRPNSANYAVGSGRFWHNTVPPENWRQPTDLLDSFDPSSSSSDYLKSSLLNWQYGPMGNGSGFYFDLDPDVFYFNFAGYSGKFVFEVHNGVQEVKMVPYQDLKVTWTFDSKNRINAFTVIDNEGTTYYFNEVEETLSVIESHPMPGYPTMQLDRQFSGQPLGDQTHDNGIVQSLTNYNSSWYISRITNANGENINFTYENEQINQLLNLPGGEVQSASAYLHPPMYYHNRSGNQVTTSAKRLTGITTEKEQLDFPANLLRSDIYMTNLGFYPLPRGNETSKVITGLNITNLITNKVLKSYNFSYSYFDSPFQSSFRIGFMEHKESQPDYKTYFKRLRLDTVVEKGSDGTANAPYIFKYKPSLPFRFSTAQDMWGYYNGATQNRTFIPKLYIYPSLSGDDRFRIYPKTNYSGQTPIYIDTFTEFGSKSLLPAADRLPNANFMDACMLEEVKFPTGGHARYTYEPHRFNFDGENYSGGGLRIGRIDNYLSDGDTQLTTSKQYSYVDPKNLSISSGRAIGIPTMASLGQSTDDLRNGVCRSSVSQAPLGTTSGSAIGYRQVTEETVDNAGQTLGKTVYSYDLPAVHGELNDLYGYGLFKATQPNKVAMSSTTNSLESYPFLPNTYPYSQNTDYDWNRGQLLSKADYNKDGKIVHETINTYGFHYARGGTVPGKVYGLSVGMFFPRLDEVQDPTKIWTYYVFGKYEYLTNISKVLKTSQDIYYDGENKLIQNTDNFFSGLFHNKLTRSDTYDSKGNITSIRFNYPESEMRIPGPFQSINSTLYNRHMTGTVLHKLTYFNNQLIRKFTTNYFQPFQDIIVPSAVEDHIYKDGIDNTASTSFLSYTPTGNLASFSKNNGPVTSYLWGYRDYYPVMSAVNASNSDIGYAGFESNNVASGWVIPNQSVALFKVADAPVGDWVAQFVRPPGIVSPTLNSSKKYLVTYFYKEDAQVSVRSVTGGVTYPSTSVVAAKGWRKGSCVINNPPGAISVTWTSYLDELKIQPLVSEGKTYTYEPLVGVTSTTDSKGQTTYYQYDEFQRLKFIKDQHKNIIKSNTYHYKN